MHEAAAAKERYDELLSPVVVGTRRLRCRAVMGSIHTNLENLEEGAERLTAFYAERARGGVAMIITGGYAPNPAGRDVEDGNMLIARTSIAAHRGMTDAVHAEGALVLLQILHSGAISNHAGCVSPSGVASPLSRYSPRALTREDVEETVQDYLRCAVLARDAGYDGIEVMGAEGFLINQFVVERTNHRADEWGGTFENRMRFPREIVREIRARLGRDFLIGYRLSVLDLVDKGSTWSETVALAKTISEAGADFINTGIGWHEARVPTVAYVAPPGAWLWATARLRSEIDIPVAAGIRINHPAAANAIIRDGGADLVSLARPLLADPAFVAKTREGREDEINTCIACNQTCLEHSFRRKVVTCVLNPRACHETILVSRPAARPRRLAVIGAGPAGLAFAVNAAQRGHKVILWEAGPEIGGQLHAARRIPGKEEFGELIRYYRRQLEIARVELRLGRAATAEDCASDQFDNVVIASGSLPKRPAIPGIESANVFLYSEVLLHSAPVGGRVAIIGSGPVAIDMAVYLTDRQDQSVRRVELFLEEWGVAPDSPDPGRPRRPAPPAPARHVVINQRHVKPFGDGLPMTIGWIHQLALRRRNIRANVGVSYRFIDGAGLHITTADGRDETLAADSIVVCAGSVENGALHTALAEQGTKAHLIGGARSVAALNLSRAIGEGSSLGLSI